jgi:hypothetical protein
MKSVVAHCTAAQSVWQLAMVWNVDNRFETGIAFVHSPYVKTAERGADSESFRHYGLSLRLIDRQYVTTLSAVET